jgi:hypothetical protein
VIVLEVIGAVVLVGLMCATTYMAIFGGLGILGAVRYVCCPVCGHLTAVSGSAAPEACPHCRHVAMFHPLLTLHDAHIWHRGVHLEPELGSGLPQHAESGSRRCA